MEHRTLLSTFTVFNNFDSGPGSLRQAMLDANANPGADAIDFNVFGGGGSTIFPFSALPTITGPTTLDATTQPGFAGTPIIEIGGWFTVGNGLTIGAGGDGSTIRGFVINGFSVDGIRVTGSSNNTIVGNYVGTDVTGTFDFGNRGNGINALNAPGTQVGGTSPGDGNLVAGNNQEGIQIRQSNGSVVQGNDVGIDATGSFAISNNIGIFVVQSNDCVVGGTAPGAGNLVSGNRNNGISMLTASGIAVQGNSIGTRAGGVGTLPNALFGINVNNTAGSLVGGTTAAARNIVGGNGAGGVNLTSGATNNIVQGNWIGIDANDNPAGNRSRGVNVQTSNNNLIGGTDPGAGNRIAYTQLAGPNAFGVVVQSGTGNRISQNSIHSNQRLGIDLLPPGVNPNDPQDPDVGGNALQNSPEITSVLTGGGNTVVGGVFNSIPNSTFTLEFFRTPASDPNGLAEGEHFLTAVSVTTDAAGDASFSVTVPAIAANETVTATATDASGNTSEFSPVQVNTTPAAVADSYFVLEDNTLDANDADGTATADPGDNGVLVNDTDADGDTLSAVLVSGPTNGSVVLDADGTFAYTPNANFNGSDSFTYKANDGEADGNVVTVSIFVGGVNDVPVAAADAYTVNEETTLFVSWPGVLGNDQDVDGDFLFSVLDTSPSNGTLSFGFYGDFVYTPNEDFEGTDTFTYHASDFSSNSETVTVTITVVGTTPGATIIDDPCGDGGQALLINGTDDDDQIIITPADGGGAFNVNLNGESLGGPFVADRIIIRGETGDDNIEVAPGVDTPAWLFGESGNDRLNGGGGVNVEVGGSGDDYLIGGPTADLLIGGEGADHLVGNGGDDLLIAGRTYYDNDYSYLCNVIDYWTYPGYGYGDHVYFALYYSGLYYYSVDDSDAAGVQVDTLIGSAGDDFFIYKSGEDVTPAISELESLYAYLVYQ